MKNFKWLFSYFVVIYALLFLSMSSSVWINSAHHDNTRLFFGYNSNELKSNCANDAQYNWIHLIGRPIAAEIECKVFQYTDTLRDLGIMRIGVIGLLAFSAMIFAAFLVSLGVNSVFAGCIAIIIFTLPGAQNTVFMTNFPNALACLISLLAYVVLSHRSNITSISLLSFFISIGLLVTSMLTNQALAFTFFWGTLSLLLFSQLIISKKKVGIIILRDIFVFVLAGISYLLIKKLFINVNIPNNNYQFDLSILNMLHKIPSLFTDVLPEAATLWQMNTVGMIDEIVIFSLFLSLGGVFLVNYFSYSNKPFFSFMKSLALALIFACTFGPWILANPPLILMRVLFPIMGAIIIILAILPNIFSMLFQLSSQLKNTLEQMTGVAVMVLSLLASNYTMLMNVWNTNIEMQFAKIEMAKHKTVPRRIHLIRPIDNGIGFNGIKSVTDEFNQKTTYYKQNAFNFINAARVGLQNIEDTTLHLCQTSLNHCEQAIPKNHIFLTVSNYGEPVCKTKNMVLIDLNILVRATGTGNPNVREINSLTKCSRFRLRKKLTIR